VREGHAQHGAAPQIDQLRKGALVAAPQRADQDIVVDINQRGGAHPGETGQGYRMSGTTARNRCGACAAETITPKNVAAAPMRVIYLTEYLVNAPPAWRIEFGPSAA
jgi:hypothetical protein